MTWPEVEPTPRACGRGHREARPTARRTRPSRRKALSFECRFTTTITISRAQRARLLRPARHLVVASDTTGRGARHRRHADGHDRVPDRPTGRRRTRPLVRGHPDRHRTPDRRRCPSSPPPRARARSGGPGRRHFSSRHGCGTGPVQSRNDRAGGWARPAASPTLVGQSRGSSTACVTTAAWTSCEDEQIGYHGGSAPPSPRGPPQP